MSYFSGTPDYIPKNHQGSPCKRCGKIISTYGTSGYCLDCWHERRGGYDRRGGGGIRAGLSQADRIKKTLEHHAQDKTHYHYLVVDGETVAEHRYVFEKATGKPIPKNYIVHHFNGFKGDNRPENLFALHKGEHDTKSIVNILKERIRQLEAICGQ